MTNLVNDIEKCKAKPFKQQVFETLLNLGYNLIPCDENKQARVLWAQYQTKRVSNGDLREWVEKWPSSNWLILTGNKPYSEAPGLIVVDGDDAEAVAKIEELCLRTPLTTATSRGKHFWYRRPIRDERVKGRNGTVLDGKKYKIDVRADGNVAVMPGSRHGFDLGTM